MGSCFGQEPFLNYKNPLKEKVYDLEERTFRFAKRVRYELRIIPRSTANLEDSRQLIKSSGSLGANYIEANESLGNNDFLMPIKISQKEANESAYFVRLILETNELNNSEELVAFQHESNELKMIFSSIPTKSKSQHTRMIFLKFEI